MAELLITTTVLDSMCTTFTKAGYKWQVVPAPVDATTFDKMLIIYANQHTIRQVHLYSSKENKFIAAF